MCQLIMTKTHNLTFQALLIRSRLRLVYCRESTDTDPNTSKLLFVMLQVGWGGGGQKVLQTNV